MIVLSMIYSIKILEEIYFFYKEISMNIYYWVYFILSSIINQYNLECMDYSILFIQFFFNLFFYGLVLSLS